MQNGKGHERLTVIKACASQGSFGERNVRTLFWGFITLLSIVLSSCSIIVISHVTEHWIMKVRLYHSRVKLGLPYEKVVSVLFLFFSFLFPNLLILPKWHVLLKQIHVSPSFSPNVLAKKLNLLAPFQKNLKHHSNLIVTQW